MLKRWDTNKNDEDGKKRKEIANASTLAREVDEYIRNDLSKKVENLGSYQQKMKTYMMKLKNSKLKMQLMNSQLKK